MVYNILEAVPAAQAVSKMSKSARFAKYIKPGTPAKFEAAYEGIKASFSGADAVSGNETVDNLENGVKSLNHAKDSLLAIPLSKIPDSDVGKKWLNAYGKTISVALALTKFHLEQKKKKGPPESPWKRARKYMELGADIAGVFYVPLGVGLAGINLAERGGKAWLANATLRDLGRIQSENFNAGRFLNRKLNEVNGQIADVDRIIEAYEKQRANHRRSNAKEPQDAKGVRIFINPEILDQVLNKGSEMENAQLFSSLGKKLGNARESRKQVMSDFINGIKLRFRSGKNLRELDGLVAVSLRSVVSRAQKYRDRWEKLPSDLQTPGEISRIHGFIIDEKGGDIFLLGRRDPRSPPLKLDILSVGIRSVWREGRTPFCSLDPDPKNPGSSNKVRLHGVPDDSEFGLIMLEADYAMKRILFGIQNVRVRGYVTLKEIIYQNRMKLTNTVANRFWFYPVQPKADDIQVSSDRNAAIFFGGIRVLNEQMNITQQGYVGSGRTFPMVEEAAASFTRHFDSLANKEIDFHRLQGIFDVVLLANIWKRMNLKSDLLEQLSALPYNPVEIRDSYPGISVKVFEIPTTQGVFPVKIYGGVQIKIAAGPRKWLVYDDPQMNSIRSRLRRTPTHGKVALPLRGLKISVVETDPERHDASNLLLTNAYRNLASGKPRETAAGLTKVLKSDSYDTEALALRALAFFQQNRLKLARRDAQRAYEIDPHDSINAGLAARLLFEVELLDGNPDLALRWIERALKADPTSSRSHVLRGSALARLGKVSKARREFRKAIKL